MADTKISADPAVTSTRTTDLIPIITTVATNPTNSHIAVSDFNNVVYARDYGAVGDGSTDDLAAIDLAIAAAAVAGSGGTQGAAVYFDRGAYMVSGPVVVPNRVKLVGSSARGTQIRATAGFAGSYVIDFVNGTTAMFDTGLIDIGVSANDLAATSCVRHNAFQENSDFINVHFDDFTVYGLELVNGYGGAAQGKMTNVECLGNTGATAGIYVNVAGFVLNVDSLTSNGTDSEQAGFAGLQVEAGTVEGRALHFENAIHGLFLSGTNAQARVDSVTGHSTVTNTIRCSATSNRLWATNVGVSNSTSFSDGIDDESVVLGDFYYPVRQTFNNDATPSVNNRCPVYLHAGTATVTQFDNVLNHQEWISIIVGANQTWDFSANAALVGNAGVDITFADDDAIFCKHYAGVTYCSIIDKA